MNLNQYQQETRQFARYPHIGSNLWYPALGLSEELGGLEEAIERSYAGKGSRTEVVKEAGDCTWNLAQVCTEARFQLEDVLGVYPPSTPEVPYQTSLSQIYKINYKLSGIAGRYHRDCQLLSDVRPAIADLVGCIWRSLELDMGIRQISMGEILEANLDKLRSRQERGVLQGSGDNR